VIRRRQATVGGWHDGKAQQEYPENNKGGRKVLIFGMTPEELKGMVAGRFRKVVEMHSGQRRQAPYQNRACRCIGYHKVILRGTNYCIETSRVRGSGNRGTRTGVG
jgi:hypothetical protein